MFTLFDLQEHLEQAPVGEITNTGFLKAHGVPLPTLSIEETDGVKSIKVSNRTLYENGAVIDLSALGDLEAGDRITVTGRVLGGTATDWGIALFAGEGETNQLTQHINPEGLFSLSYILEPADVGENLMIHTTQWGIHNSDMDFFIDSILATRIKASLFSDLVVRDPRDVIYSLYNDTDLPWSPDEETAFTNTRFLRLSGVPIINLVDSGGRRSLHVMGRARDFDGLDIRVSNMTLLKGNEYHIKVKGRIDGECPENMRIMLQGLPGYLWRSVQRVSSNDEFTLEHTISGASVEKWTEVRITSDAEGAMVPFYVDLIEIRRVNK